MGTEMTWYQKKITKPTEEKEKEKVKKEKGKKIANNLLEILM